ncbi:hypothetical protein VDGL01_05907 [Verticillium dahliae]
MVVGGQWDGSGIADAVLRIRLFFENRSCVSRLSSILPPVCSLTATRQWIRGESDRWRGGDAIGQGGTTVDMRALGQRPPCASFAHSRGVWKHHLSSRKRTSLALGHPRGDRSVFLQSPFFAVRDFLGKAGVARNAARGMHMCCAVDHMARTTGNGAARPPVPSGNSPPTRVLPLGGGTISGQGGCGVRGGRTVMVNFRSKVQNGRWKSRRDSEHMHLDLHRRAGELRKVKGRALRDACSSPAMADGRCWQS